MSGHRRPWTLRHQLVALLIALVLAVCAILTTVSTLSLRSELLGQLGSKLSEASQRAIAHPPGELIGDLPRSGGSPDPEDLPVPDQIPGQDAGTIDLLYAGDTLVRDGYIDETGTFRALTDTQVAELRAVPADGKIHPVELTGLGSYRAISTTDRSGNQVITAMPTTSVDDPLRSYLAVEFALVVLAVALTAAAGTLLVRRALRPLERVAAAALTVSELPLGSGEVAEITGVDPRDTDERTEVGTVGAALDRLLGHVETSLAARHESETQVRQFVADASHELRTPLASIRGYAELVRRSPDEVPPDTVRALDRIESEAARMGALVEDLLLLARLDAGRPLDRAEVDLARLAVDAVADAYAASSDHGWHLVLPSTPEDSEDGPDTLVRGDEARLRQVFANLLGNARVHTPTGTEVTVELRPAEDAVVLVVADTGPGVPASLATSLFQRFSRGDGARNRTGGSTGLGLAIVQAVVHEHGGTITVSTEEPTGTRFEVRLPRGGVPAVPEAGHRSGTAPAGGTGTV